jgi:hypothetical protein
MAVPLAIASMNNAMVNPSGHGTHAIMNLDSGHP